MIVMALDHANLFIAHGHSSPEMWAGGFHLYDDPLIFFTRAITHLAAPGFFFLMGAAMILVYGLADKTRLVARTGNDSLGHSRRQFDSAPTVCRKPRVDLG